jgi:hypothetical protein
MKIDNICPPLGASDVYLVATAQAWLAPHICQERCHHHHDSHKSGCPSCGSLSLYNSWRERPVYPATKLKLDTVTDLGINASGVLQ